jgi:hypothetical protein
MKNFLILIVVTLISGCSINKLIPPPYAAAIVEHERFFGLNAKIPYAGSALLEIQLGWGSAVWSLIPVATNKLFSAPISDTFKLGSEIGMSPTTTIIEDLQTFTPDGPPPTPRYGKMFDANIKLRPIPTTK